MNLLRLLQREVEHRIIRQTADSIKLPADVIVGDDA